MSETAAPAWTPGVFSERSLRVAGTRALVIGAAIAGLRVFGARTADLRPLFFLWGLLEGIGAAATLALIEVRVRRDGDASAVAALVAGALGWAVASLAALVAALAASWVVVALGSSGWPRLDVMVDSGVPGLPSGAMPSLAVFAFGPALALAMLAASRARGWHPVDQTQAGLVGTAALGLGAVWLADLPDPERRILPGTAILLSGVAPALAFIVDAMERLRADAEAASRYPLRGRTSP